MNCERVFFGGLECSVFSVKSEDVFSVKTPMAIGLCTRSRRFSPLKQFHGTDMGPTFEFISIIIVCVCVQLKRGAVLPEAFISGCRKPQTI